MLGEIVILVAASDVEFRPWPAYTGPMSDQPTPLSAFVFAGKVAAFRTRRLLIDAMSGPAKLRAAASPDFPAVAGHSDTPLWSDETLAERAMQRGKVHNLRVACRLLDGLAIPAGAVFSFWRQLGPPWASRGFVPGRMLKQGCLMPVVGGGLCQLSNALYDVALQAGCTIIERHAHSRVIPGSVAALGRDATVAWNYVDLRFAPTRDLRLSVRMDKDRLTVALAGRSPSDQAPAPVPSVLPSIAARSCASCGETACHMHRREMRIATTPTDRAAFLADEAWPEFQEYLRATRQFQDWFGCPLARRWTVDGFARRFDAPVAAVRRGLGVRWAKSAAARRKTELTSTQAIAIRLARHLPPDAMAVTVAQSFLPFLWRDGHLGGRSVNVLMTRLPAWLLHRRLDAAFAEHPERSSLADFRWPEEIVRAEAEALAQADRIVTPHAEIAALFGDRAVLLPWSEPPARPTAVRGPIRRIAFPGPTIARKGAHAVREAARVLDLEVVPMGAAFEGENFWDGVRVSRSQDWTNVDALVQPALAEEQPRRLLAALAKGIPVFASPACGLAPRPGLTLVPPDDAAALITALTAPPPAADVDTPLSLAPQEA
jgi:hypothetical protein